MVGILQFFDFGQGRSSHKLPLLSRRNDGEISVPPNLVFSVYPTLECKLFVVMPLSLVTASHTLKR